jgi:hypothetical protein
MAAAMRVAVRRLRARVGDALRFVACGMLMLRCKVRRYSARRGRHFGDAWHVNDMLALLLFLLFFGLRFMWTGLVDKLVPSTSEYVVSPFPRFSLNALAPRSPVVATPGYPEDGKEPSEATFMASRSDAHVISSAAHRGRTGAR